MTLSIPIERANVFMVMQLMLAAVILVVPLKARLLEVLSWVWLLASLIVRCTRLVAKPLSSMRLVLVLSILASRLRELILILIVMLGNRLCIVSKVVVMLLVVIMRPLPTSVVLDSDTWRPILFL